MIYIFYTELLLKIRHAAAFLYPLAFFLIVICLFPIIVTGDTLALKKMLPGFIWLAALLASLLSIENIFSTDVEEGYLDQYLQSELPFTAIIYTKLLIQWLVAQAPLILLTAIIAFLFALPSSLIGVLILTLMIGTPVLTTMGAFIAALTLGLQQRGVLLGLIFLPLVMPILIFGASIVDAYQVGLNVKGPLFFLTGITLLSITFLPWLISLSLREIEN